MEEGMRNSVVQGSGTTRVHWFPPFGRLVTDWTSLLMPPHTGHAAMRKTPWLTTHGMSGFVSHALWSAEHYLSK